jgi:hypothetical protein
LLKSGPCPIVLMALRWERRRTGMHTPIPIPI